MRALLAAIGLALLAGSGVAQPLDPGAPVPGVVRSPVLVIDFEQAFVQSAYGKRVAAQVEADSLAIAEENRRIEAELIEEERQLTETREGMAPAEFRALADGFNEKVERLRAEQDEKARALRSNDDAARRKFAEAVRPVLGALMQEAGAAVILERRGVFLSIEAVDVTALAVRRIDAAIGDGLPQPEPQPQEPPATDSP